MPDNQGRLRLGMVGSGRLSRELARAVLSNEPPMTLSRATKQAAAEIAGMAGHECQVSEDWRQAINPNQVDGVMVVGPPQERAAVIQDALGVGLPVMALGPIATNAGDLNLLNRLAGMSGGTLMVLHPILFSGPFQAIKEIATMIGQPAALRVTQRLKLGGLTADAAGMLWAGSAEGVAAAIDVMGKKPKYTSAEKTLNGAVNKMVFDHGPTAHAAVVDADTESLRIEMHFDKAVLVHDSSEGPDKISDKITGLKLYPPTAGFASPAPDSPFEPVDSPQVDAAETMVKTFALLVSSGEMEDGALDFAGDVATVMMDAASNLAE